MYTSTEIRLSQIALSFSILCLIIITIIIFAHSLSLTYYQSDQYAKYSGPCGGSDTIQPVENNPAKKKQKRGEKREKESLQECRTTVEDIENGDD